MTAGTQDKFERSRASVQKWVDRHLDAGLEALRERPHPGGPTKLAPEREATFKARLISHKVANGHW